MFESFKRGWAMAKASWAVLKDQPSLAVFPVISGVAAIALTAALALPVMFGADVATRLGASDTTMESLGYLALFVWYFVCTFAVVFCNAALIFCALRKFAGQPTTVRAGFAAAGRRLPQILGWALVASTVGVALQALQSMLRDKVGVFGDILGGITEGLWGVATYFAVPVVVTEGLGPIAAIKRSSSVLRKTWGESLGGATGLNLVMLILVLLPAVVVGSLALLGVGGSAVLVTLGSLFALYVVALIVVFTALGSIFRAGVYSYATTGVAPGHMDAGLLQSTFRPRSSPQAL